MSKIKCPNCGALNPENTQTCQECGTSLIDQIEDCLDIANPDTTCKTPDKSSNRVLLYSIMIIIILIVIVALILSFAPTAYWS
ncbi:MAG TPA: zinc-ribbon domain-containing protein [Methanobacterium sp.]